MLFPLFSFGQYAGGSGDGYHAAPFSVPLSTTENTTTGSDNPFPNPTQNWLYFTEKYATSTKEVFDFTGKLIFKFVADKVDLSFYSSGIYFIKVQDKNNQISNFKIIKQ